MLGMCGACGAPIPDAMVIDAGKKLAKCPQCREVVPLRTIFPR